VGGTVVGAAQAWLGASYVFGGLSPSGTDCSGLSEHAYGAAGVQLPHSVVAQRALCVGLDTQDLSPGDLVFSLPLGLPHVGIYIGGNQMIHSAPSIGGVGVSDVNYEHPILGYGRPRAVLGMPAGKHAPNVFATQPGPGGTALPTQGSNKTIDQTGQPPPTQGPLPGGIFGGVQVMFMQVVRYGEVVLGGAMVFIGAAVAVAGMSGLADTAVGVASRGVVNDARSRIAEPALRRRRSIISEGSVSAAQQREAARRETVGFTAEQRRATARVQQGEQRRTATSKARSFEESRTAVARQRAASQQRTTEQRYQLIEQKESRAAARKAKPKTVTKVATKQPARKTTKAKK
jgi:hypothetical protein